MSSLHWGPDTIWTIGGRCPGKPAKGEGPKPKGEGQEKEAVDISETCALHGTAQLKSSRSESLEVTLAQQVAMASPVSAMACTRRGRKEPGSPKRATVGG